jgi:hypothetical protein
MRQLVLQWASERGVSASTLRGIYDCAQSLQRRGHIVDNPREKIERLDSTVVRLIIAYPFVKTEKVGFLKCMISFLSTGCGRIDPRPFFRLIPAPGTDPTKSRPRGGHPE